MNAQQLHQQGRKAGEAGNYQEAIEIFKQAHQADPQWPYPLYDIAYTYLLQEEYEKAYEYYKKTEVLSRDGFFTTKTALWTLDREQAGDFASGLYRAYLQSEWLPDNQRLSVLQQMIERYPDFAPAYKGLLALYRSPETRWDLIEKALDLDDMDDETYGILIVNKALILQFGQQPEDCQRLINAYLASPRATAAGRALANSIIS
jgi:tetratricopeptide (TPR) repeat protein